MNILRFTPFSHRYLGLAALLVAPVLVGARGCGVGVVGSECGGLRGAECATGQFCDYELDAACGAADQTGTCQEVPEFCTEQFDPVCGCDGQTYGNACAANAAGVSVASEGECAPAAGDDCGGLLGAGCADGEFCKFAPEAQCGAADQTGTCEPIPEVCTFIFAPVCGCDGQTYDNECAASAAGVSVVSQGECATPGGSACGGLLGGGCADGEFCNFPLEAICGAADATGVCEAIPEVCTREFNPVCGCDDQTYSNVCEAHAAGVSVASEGECAPSTGGTVCGGFRGQGCGDGEFCNFPLEAICGAADATGVCEPIPEGCIEIFAPVCGCDGQTYGNSCEANRAGVSVASDGECAPSTGGAVCGGLLGGACGDGEFCNFPLEAICGAADATGICEPIPSACTREFNPVCGCDDQTYSNPCVAHSAGVSIASEGECAPTGGSVCGGLLGTGCAEGEFCSFAPEAQCGAADQTGTCAPRPDVCTQQFDPVCGCDGNTYGNACNAANAGVSVASLGECP